MPRGLMARLETVGRARATVPESQYTRIIYTQRCFMISAPLLADRRVVTHALGYRNRLLYGDAIATIGALRRIDGNE